MTPRVLLDVDGVLADFVSAYLAIVKTVTGREYAPEQVTAFDISKCLGLAPHEASLVKREVGLTVQLARLLEPYPGAIDGARALQAVADVYIVTSPWNSNPTWTHDREAWLLRHFGIPHSRIVHTSAKHLVAGDFLVDDKTSTLREWAGEFPMGTPIQWATPHNRLDGWTGIATCDWSELVAAVERGPVIEPDVVERVDYWRRESANALTTADSPAPPASAGPAGGETGDLLQPFRDALARHDAEYAALLAAGEVGPAAVEQPCSHADSYGSAVDYGVCLLCGRHTGRIDAPAITRTPAVELGEEES